MSKKPKFGSVFSSRKNPETGKIEIYEIPPEEVEESLNRAFQTWRQQETASLPVKRAGAHPILTVMADFGSGPFLWINREGNDCGGIGGNCCDAIYRCGSHPMSDALFDAFIGWITEFETASWARASSGELDLNWPDFHERGLSLAKRLKDEVGTAFRVIYVKPVEDPAHREDERREILDNGSVVLLPPGRDSWPLFSS